VVTRSKILWSLEEAGVPLFRKDLYDYYQSNLFQRKLSRLADVDGIGIEGNELLLSDKNGDRIVSRLHCMTREMTVLLLKLMVMQV